MTQARRLRRTQSIVDLLRSTPLSDREIAEAADVSESTVYRWKKGRRNVSIGHMQDVARRHEKLINELKLKVTTVRRHAGWKKEMAGLDRRADEGYHVEV